MQQKSNVNHKKYITPSVLVVVFTEDDVIRMSSQEVGVPWDDAWNDAWNNNWKN